MKLTATTIRALSLPAGKSEVIHFDDDVPGFGIRLRDGGSRTFVFQYKLGEKQRRMVLGSSKAVDIGKARDTAKDLYAAVRLGRDPAGEKATAKVKAAETFAAVVESFLARQRPRLKPRSLAEVERHLLVHAKPLHGLQLGKIERRTIATRLSEVIDASGSVTANRVRATLSAFFGWCMREGMIETNPVVGTNRETEQSRDRVLTAAELKLVWNTLEDDHYGAIIRLLALTGQRASEIAGLRRSELHDEMIVLPPERTKNGRTHVVPLSTVARAILDAQPQRGTSDGKPRDLIFGYADGPFSGWSNSKERLDERLTEAAGKPLPHWTPHDLRRTTATHMAELGIQPHVIEAVLNHVSGHKAGVAGIYNRSTYEREKRAALDLWAEHLSAIVEGRTSNVTPLRRQA